MAYAVQTDLARVGLSPDLTANIPSATIDAALEARSRFVGGYLAAAGYTLPLVAWPADVTLCVCKLVAWDLMAGQSGIQPDQPGDATWKELRDEALAWLRDVQARRTRPDGIVDSTPAADEGGPECQTDTPRGW